MNKKKQKTIADALIELSDSVPEQELSGVVDSAIKLLDHEDAADIRRFPGRVVEALQKRDGVVIATLTTPSGDVGHQRAEIIALIEKRLGGKLKVQLHEQKDPSMIGGAVLTIGDERYDVSIRTALSELVEHLLTSMLRMSN